MIKILLLLSSFAVIAIAAPKIAYPSSFPKDCSKRLEKVDQTFQESLIILDPKEVLYENEKDFDKNYCRYDSRNLSVYTKLNIFCICIAN